MTDLNTLESDVLAQVAGAADLQALDAVRVAAVGKTGSISGLLKTLGAMSPEERKARGPEINGLRDRMAKAIADRKAELEAAELDGATIVGQFQPETGESEQFGLLLAKDSKLTPCVSLAVDALADDGTLKALQEEWLNQATDVPELK